MTNRAADTGFFVIINGQVESGQIDDVDHLVCKYTYNYGADWNRIHGVEHGTSQIAIRTPGPDASFTWNYPLDSTFHSTNVHGWPQLVLSVWGISWSGNDTIQGYGCTFLPTTPGRHTRYIRLYAPFSSSQCQRFTAWITGDPPEFFDPLFIASGRGREVTRVRSAGVIKVTFNIATKNMSDWGYVVNGSGERLILCLCSCCLLCSSQYAFSTFDVTACSVCSITARIRRDSILFHSLLIRDVYQQVWKMFMAMITIMTYAMDNF
jgi:B9 domain-containing protein 1